jgi:hypothetical protein
MMKKLLLMMAVLAVPAMTSFAQDYAGSDYSTTTSPVERGFTISGEVTAKGYVSPSGGSSGADLDKAHGASLADDDTHIRFTYNFSEYSGAMFSLGFNGGMNEKPSATVKDVWGWSDILGELGMNKAVGLRISMGMLKDDGGIGKRHFNASRGLDFGFNSGDDVYTDTGAATDTYNWRLDIPMNFMSDVFPLNLGVISDLDFSRNNGGHSTIVELSSQNMNIADGMMTLNWNVYYQNFMKSDSGTGSSGDAWNEDTAKHYDFMAVGGSLGLDMAIGNSMLLGVGTAMTWQEQRNFLDLADPKRHEFNMAVGTHFGMVDIFDLHVGFMGYQAESSNKAFTKNWLALRADFLMIPKVKIFGGLGIGLSDTITNKISYEVGMRFDPIDNLNFMVGWQAGSDELGSIEAVQETVKGAIYVRATWLF